MAPETTTLPRAPENKVNVEVLCETEAYVKFDCEVKESVK
jgi:hypothetical protein